MANLSEFLRVYTTRLFRINLELKNKVFKII